MRIGDKAVIYSYLAGWRKTNQTRKLTLLTDPALHETGWAKQLPNDWLFSGLVDELVEDELGNSLMHKPPGENLYYQHLFSCWKQLGKRPPIAAAPTLPEPCRVTASNLLLKHKVPPRYAVVSPLFDAKYDKHRNLHPTWWQNVVLELSRFMPVVLIGDHANMLGYPLRTLPSCHNLYTEQLTPMHSLGLIRQAAVYVGGETGMTLWAALLGTPVVAAYQFWHKPWSKNQQKNLDTRPISAGAPVAWAYPPNGAKSVLQQVRTIAKR